MNLIEGLQHEMNRSRKLLQQYKSIPTGGFGALMIQNSIDATEKAIANGDTVEMLRCYSVLKENK